MEFNICPMSLPYAQTIADWHYEGIYAFYDMDQDADDLEELLNPNSWPNTYFAVVNEYHDLVGFYCFEKDAGSVEIGLGLKPDLTGKGFGYKFVEAGIEFAKQKFTLPKIVLKVATFNQRAIRLYEKMGFKKTGTFINQTNGGQYEFLQMVKTV